MKKYCISCGKNRPMFMYHKDDSKYKIKANKGKTIECRFCSLKRNLNDKGFTHRIDGKFTFTQATKKQIILNFFKR
jgi:hypothetical protein